MIDQFDLVKEAAFLTRKMKYKDTVSRWTLIEEFFIKP